MSNLIQQVRPKLTLGIPVFNEIQHIGQTLNSIILELANLNYNIEIIVSDNGSDDGSTKFLEKFATDFSHGNRVSFRLIKQGINKGFNVNCDTIISSSNGEYLWVLGAQETLLPGALSEIGKFLDRGPRQLVVNAQVWDESTNSLANPHIYGLRKESYYTDCLDFYTDLGGPCRSISLNIVKTDLVKRTLSIPIHSHYWGMFERHAHSCFMEGEGEGFIYIATPIVKILIEEKGWQLSGEDDFGTEIITRAFPGFYADIEMAEIGRRFLVHGKEIRNSIGVWRDQFGIVRTIISAKCTGLKVDPSLIWKMVKTYREMPWFWALGLPILFVPSAILNTKVLENARAATHLVRTIFRMPAK